MRATTTFEQFKSDLVRDLRNTELIVTVKHIVVCGKTSITVERSAENATSSVLTDDDWDVYQYLGDKLASGVSWPVAIKLAEQSAADAEYERILGELPERVGV